MGRRTRPETVEFPAEGIGLVVEKLAAHPERGWVNVSPIPTDEDPPPAGLFAVFGARGPAVPLATFIPPRAEGGRPVPAEVGLSHGLNRKVLPVLAEAGAAVPETWTVLQDHNRRGLVMRCPEGTSVFDVLRWMLAACDAVCRVPTTGRWRAQCYFPAA